MKQLFIAALCATVVLSYASPACKSIPITPTTSRQHAPATNSATSAKAPATSRNMRTASPSMSVASSTSSAGNTLYQQWHDGNRNRDVPVKIYLPPSSTAPQPVVIFSHGLGGSREAAQYLGVHWSSRGYVCVFVQHIGSDSSVWEPVKTQGKDAILKNMNAAIGPRTFMDRVNDITFVLDELERLQQAPGPLHKRMDLSRIAIGGHSYGAGTSLTMAGQNYKVLRRSKSFGDPRIKAAIYLSPPVNLRNHTAKEIYGDIKIPGMLMTGTEDNSPIGQATAKDRRIPYDGMTAPNQYLVIFNGGDHMIFNGATRREARPGDKQMLSEIERLTTAFLDAYLRGDTKEQQWLDTKASQYVASDATYEHK